MAKKQSTCRIGAMTIQERNMACPSGPKVWLVKDAEGKTVYSSRSKADAIAWAKESQRY